MNFYKVILIVLGTLSLCVGIIGIVVPGLPTTPFLLLTAALYVKSSDRLYQKLLSSRIAGPYISEFQTKNGMTKRTKLHAIGTMWVMITISCLFFITPDSLKIVILIIGLAGTIVMGILIPTR